jgi:hypothetical protein
LSLARATAVATEVREGADQLGQPYLHVLASELLAASVAVANRTEASRLLDAANDERQAIRVPRWPLEPYRHAAHSLMERTD